MSTSKAIYHELHRLVRLIRREADSDLIRILFRKNHLMENFEVKLSNPDCPHGVDCRCKLQVTGRSHMTSGFVFESGEGSRASQAQELVEAVKSTMKCTDQGIDVVQDTEVARFSNALEKGGNIKIIPDPIGKGGFPMSETLRGLAPEISDCLKDTDIDYFAIRFPFITVSRSECERWIWTDGLTLPLPGRDQPEPTDDEPGPVEQVYDVPPLWALILRRESRWRMAFGKINGRPVYAYARANLWPLKYLSVVLQQNKRSHLVNDRGKVVLQNLSATLAHLYRMLGVKAFGTVSSKISIEDDLLGMYLGSSAGPNKGLVREIRVGDAKVHITPHGKKYEMHGFDLDVFLRLVREGKDIPVYWAITPKSEIFFSFDKQWYDDKWQKFQDKCRVFVIPSSNFVILERLVSKIRMLKERGPCIRIGHRWSRGGMDSIAECLGIGLAECFESLLCDGDVDKFDMRVKAFFVNLYYSSMLIHEDPRSEDYELKKKIIKKIIKAIIARITQLFGDVWGIQRGGVPSGCYNTSHMDSWVMALYFCLFCVYQILMSPPEHKVQLEEEFIKVVKLIVYGDDHVYNKGKGLGATYFSSTLFAKFLEDCFDVELRDVRDGIPFCSREMNGWLVGEPGMIFLRHYAVINRNKTAGQSTFLPYRETREFVSRAVWGREPKERDLVDTMLSVLGHVYGTHGSNRDAYVSLRLFYKNLVRRIDGPLDAAADEMVNRVDRHDIRKMRQHGITVEDIKTGFPTWKNLQKRNIYDKGYQDITVNYEDLDDLDLAEYDAGY